MVIFLKHKTKFIKQGKSVQEIQDDIFRKMSAAEKIKLALDFASIGIELKLPEGTRIPTSYLKQWIKWNRLKNRRGISKLLSLCRPIYE